MKNATRLTSFLLLTCAALLARPCAASPNGWEFTNSLNVERQDHTATLLPSGQVLVAAGGTSEDDSLVSAELYDPATMVWSLTGSLTGRRHEHSATLLPNGMVLVAGGYDTSFGGGNLATCELYNPATETWTTTGSMHDARSHQSAILLNTGKVLVAAGSAGAWLASAELYDPNTGTWTTTGSLATARVFQTATLLPSGKVLVVGGGNGVSYASAELYDPATGKWTPTGSLTTGRNSHTATLLQNGLVLVAGGIVTTGATASAELYNPATGTWTVTGSLVTARDNHTATLLPNGQVLIAGGSGTFGSTPVATELYDPTTGTFSNTGSLNQARYFHTATLLQDGTVLAAGGHDSSVFALNTAELYGSPVQLPTTTDGRGAFDNQGNEVTFQFRVTQGDQDIIGYLAFCDPAADVCTNRGRVQSLTIAGTNATFSGYVQLSGQRVTFDASVNDNSPGGTADTFSINLSNGYSASGAVTSGEIRIY
jgi:galactose oxidase-like protein/Kelch motif protein